MEQYISKSAIIAEIERRISEVEQIDKASYEVGLLDAYKIILSFINTLEVKEIDSTDAFIEKTVSYLKENLLRYIDLCEHGVGISTEEFIEEFKNYMKRE